MLAKRLPMTAILVCLSIVGATGPAHATTCFQVNPETAGWKYVRVPDGYVFGPDVEQFRPNKSVTLYQAWPVGQRIVYGERKRGWHHEATLQLGNTGSSKIRLEFSPPLERLKLEVNGYDKPLGFYWVRRKFRHSGRFLDLDLPSRREGRLKIVFHSHFRKRPHISQAWLGNPQVLDRQVVPDGLWDEQLLFFRSLDGSGLELCNTVGGQYQVFEMPRLLNPQEIQLPESYQKWPGHHRRWIGAAVAGFLIILLIFAAIFALRPAGKATQGTGG